MSNFTLDEDRLRNQANQIRKKAFSFKKKEVINSIIFQFGKEMFYLGFRAAKRRHY